jgi:hypothetical protein
LTTIEAYPLCWPAGRPRTPSYRRETARFKTSFAAARDELRREVDRLGGRNLIVSTNIPLRNDGLPYASYKKLDDEGVAIYFTYKTKPMSFACDRWNRVEHNMQAICKTIDALRGIARWGSGDMLEAAFTGFAQLPPPIAGEEPWYVVLNVDPDSEYEDVRKAYQWERSDNHPDKGGDAAKFDRVQRAWEQYEAQR